MTGYSKFQVKLGDKLAFAIKTITNDFRIGFGSFVDKEVMPFISLVKGKNCQQGNCPKPYSFQHQMDLGPNAAQFSKRVQEAPISGNIDNPEGGFDGLVQVLMRTKATMISEKNKVQSFLRSR